MSKLTDYMVQIGVEPNNNNHLEDVKAYHGGKIIYMYLRQLENDFYFSCNDEIYKLPYNEKYFSLSETEQGKFPDSRKINFEDAEKIGILNPHSEEVKESNSTDDLSAEYFIRLNTDGSWHYAKCINGKVKSIVLLSKDKAEIELYNEGLAINFKNMGFANTTNKEYEQAFNKALNLR